MNRAQPAIFARGTRAHHFLEFALAPGATPGELRDRLRVLRSPAVTDLDLNVLVALAPAIARALAPEGTPWGLAPLETIPGFPEPRADVLVWIHTSAPDIALDAARAIASGLAPIAALVGDVPAFSNREARDLTGFIDGTENPPAAEASAVALIGEPARLAGSSIALVQRWRHDLDSFSSLSTAEQERVFGRTKPDSVEFDEDRMPADAHVARTSLKVGSESLPIYRRSMPYGDAADHGLLFIAFTHDQGRIALMLASMAGETDGVRDALTHFSTPESGAYYFVPSFELLEEIAAGS